MSSSIMEYVITHESRVTHESICIKPVRYCLQNKQITVFYRLMYNISTTSTYLHKFDYWIGIVNTLFEHTQLINHVIS